MSSQLDHGGDDTGMSKFFYADGRIEDHDTDPTAFRWEIAHEPEFPNLAEFLEKGGPNSPFVVISIFTFERVENGSMWEVSPGEFDPHTALVRLADEVEALKALLLKTGRMLRKMTYAETDPVEGVTWLRDLDGHGVAWWRDE